MLYFDHCATSPLDPAITARYVSRLETHWFNPASPYRKGLEANRLISDSLRDLSTRFGVSDRCWVFTSGASESIVHALRGSLKRRGEHKLPMLGFDGDHEATMHTLKEIRHEGYPVDTLPLDAYGAPDLAALEEHLIARREAEDPPRLLSVLYVNNETGAVADHDGIRALRDRLAPDMLLHYDMVQAPGRQPVDLIGSGADLATFSGHKLGAPRGVGLLYVRETLHLLPILRAGGQQHGMRGGTENAPLFAAMAEALIHAVDIRETAVPHARRLSHIVRETLDAADVDYVINGAGPDGEPQTAAILNLGFPGVKGETLLHLLEEADIMVSSSSACTSRDADSHVLRAMGIPEHIRRGALRISFAGTNTPEDAATLGDVLAEKVGWLKRVLGGR